MIARRAVWHALHPTDMVIPDGQAPVPVPLAECIPYLAPGEVVTVIEPEESDALATLSAHFQLSIVEEK